ncbi:MAG: helicase-related protein [Pseudomonadota bacterium]
MNSFDRTITAVLGPTNTGKTHYALDRMLARETGIIGLPLRLLAREIYDKLVALRGPNAVALVTGEEKIAPARAKYFVCTVEAMPIHEPVDFVAIDEVQMCADPDRGHVFTDRLLHARGRYETLFLGSDTIRPRISELVPRAQFQRRERISTLTWSGPKKISRLKPRTAVVAFSVEQVYAIAELIRRQRGGAAVVMGALSPRTRNAQVALYQEGEVDYLVATDAIGMGLNMDIDHVAFAGTSKFDGWRHRHLQPNELAQIAGRAGRFTKDGTFSVTGEAAPFAPEVIDAIENHQFKPLAKLMWRNRELPFHKVDALLAALDIAPDEDGLTRAREAEDQTALKTLWADPEIQDVTTDGKRVRLLWDVCQIPDFRKVSPGEHAALLAGIYRFLLGRGGCIPSDWLAGQIRRLDRVDGDIDALSKRLAFIRTWTYVANRPAWVEEPDHWRGETRAVEDRLSDALHQRLTQRFVDRRTSVLMRRLKQKERLVADVNDKGEVTAEGQYLGRLDGFRFTVDETASGDELKTLKSASLSALQSEFARRADKLYLSPDSEMDVTEQGGLMWGTDAIGRLAPGEDPLTPQVLVFVDEMAEGDVAEKVQRRMSHWVNRKINALFEPMQAMRDDQEIMGLAKGVAFRLAENFGVIPRREIAQDVKSLAQEERALLRKHGVRFGQHFIFMPALLKPAPTRMRLLLWSLSQGHEEFPEAPPPGNVTVPAVSDLPDAYYTMAGYRRLGSRALRIDMLERLADMIRPMDVRGGFEATPDMLSITGCTLEQFADMMGGLGFQGERGERKKTSRPALAEKTDQSENATDSAEDESDAPVESAAEMPANVGSEVDPAPGTDTIAAPETEQSPDQPNADPTTTDMAEIQSDQPSVPPVEVEALIEPTASAAANSDEPTETATATEVDPADENEVYFIFRLKPRARPQGDREARGPRKDGKNKPRQAGGKKTGHKGKRGKEHGGPRKMQASPPKREKPIDPDNPFAVLQQLKND